MNKKIIVAALLGANLVLTGCAFTIHETPVNYQYSGQIVSAAKNANVGVTVAEVTDARTVDRPDIISHLVNGYGQTTTGGFAAEAPVSDIVKAGIEEGLVAAGYGTNSNDLAVSATLDDYSYDAVSGFWSVKNITAKITIGVRIHADDNLVSRNTVIGNIKVQGEEIKGMQDKEIVTLLFSRSLDNAVDQIVEIVDIESQRQ